MIGDLRLGRQLFRGCFFHYYVISNAKYEQDPIVNQLRLLFAALQSYRKRYYDPRAFIDHMEVKAGVQQDAQEYTIVLERIT